jgi:hypothetical protein
MQIERADIGSSERFLRQVREEQLVDDALSGEADATLLLGSRMGRHDDVEAEPCWSHRHVRAVVERAHQPTFWVGELLIRGKLEASLHLGSLKYPIVFAPHDEREADQGSYDSSCAILPIQPQQGTFLCELVRLHIAPYRSHGAAQFHPVLAIARVAERAELCGIKTDMSRVIELAHSFPQSFPLSAAFPVQLCAF